jgi:REP element-mobilizing transposase RayT
MTQRRIYQNEFPYHLTNTIRNNQSFFSDINKTKVLHDNIFYYQRKLKFELLCFAIMPTHFHIIIKSNIFTISDIMQKIKYQTAKQIKALPSKEDRLFPSHSTAIRWKGEKPNITVPQHSRAVRIFSPPRCPNSIWKPRFYHRIINTERYLSRAINYVTNNWSHHHLPSHFSQSPHTYLNHTLIKKYLS